jgi:hypothetical protein
VSWDQVRASIEGAICSRSIEANGHTYHYASTGSRQECGYKEDPSKLDHVVDAVFVEARPVIGAPGVAEDLRERLPAVAPEERDRVVRDAYLGDSRFVRALVPRIEAGLHEAGLECEGCPEFPDLPVKTIRYAQFRPYLEAYVWPDEVTDRLDPSGQPTGEKRYSFHICAGINGVTRIENPDPDLVRAGFVVVFGNEMIHQRAGQVFRARTGKRDMAKIATDQERTRRLRREVPPAVFSGKSALLAVCGSLERYKSDLGLRLAECR